MSTWIFLRGLMREARHWGDFPKQFQHIVGVEKIVTLDFPGNGKFYRETSLSSVPKMTEHCRSQLKLIGVQPPYKVLALSLGAMVAVNWSEQYPDEFENLVLINTSLAPLNPFYHRLRPGNYFSLFSILIHGSIFRREALILRLTSNQKRSKHQQQQLIDQWETFARECPVSRTNILRQLYAAMTFRTSTTSPRVPLFLLGGLNDHLVNVSCSSALANRWNCPIQLHPTAGHDLTLDDGEWVAQRVKEWLG